MLTSVFDLEFVSLIMSERFISLTMLNISSLTGWNRYERGMDTRRPAVIAAQKILAR